MSDPVMLPESGSSTKTRKQKPPKSDALKRKAQAAINLNAKPVPLSNLFSGFTPDLRGNIEIELDLEVAERFVVQSESVIRNLPNINFIFNGENDGPLAFMREMASGLNLAMALKLIHATPQSGLSDIADLHLLSNMSTRIPTNFIQVLNLIGKTDYYDSTIRIQDNSYYIRLHLLKAIWFALKTQSFQSHPGNFVDWQDTMSLLLKLTARELREIIFDDYSTVSVLKRKARERLETAFKETTTIVDGDRSFQVSPAYLDPNATMDEFIQWMKSIPPGFRTDQVRMATFGIASRFDRKWLKRLDVQLQSLDRRFTDSPLGDVTPRQVLTELNLRFIGMFFPEQSNFQQTVLDVHSWFSNETLTLSMHLDYTDMAKSTYGHAAQLVYVSDDDMKEHRSYYTLVSSTEDDMPDYAFAVQVPKNDATMLYSAKKLITPGEILTSASARIVKSVHLKEKFKGFCNQPLASLASNLARKSFRGQKQ